jgi:hypothetical protein
MNATTTTNVLILIANLGVLGLTLKLYTEYFKDKAQDRRKGGAS